MATSVTYKDSQITSFANGTRILKTAGKYMEDDVTIVTETGDASAITIVDEQDVHGGIIRHINAVDLTGDTITANVLLSGYTAHDGTGQAITGTYVPSGGSSGTGAISIEDAPDATGGTVRTITAVDISDTTAVASDVAQGKYFYTADGTKTAGTASGGGGGGVSPKQVNFIDYDGTILYAYTAQEANALSALPANPSHSGLTAQGWNWTLAQIKAQLTAMPDGDVWVGQMYITQSGDTEIDCTFNNPDYLSPYLTIAINGSVTVDWGDNTSPSTSTGTSLTSLKYIAHTYAEVGQYTISISVNSGTFSFYNTQIKPSVLSISGSESDRRYSRAYANCIDAIRLGTSVSIGNYAFVGCCALQSVTIPNSVTSIGSVTFQYCYSLQSVTIPDGVTSISASMFVYCCALQNVSIPNNVTSIGNNTFSNCYSLQSVSIPNNVTSIGSNAFNGCYTLQSATIPSSVTSMSNNTFNNCNSLQSVTISEGVTSIGSSAFYQCYTLRSITIPSSVTSIGSSAFYYCYGMTEYHIKPTTVPTGGANMFNGIIYGTVIYVPAASLDAYKTAANWSTYASYMQGE